MVWEVLVKNLEKLMEAKNESPHSLAVKAGLNINAVRDILVGNSRNPRHDTLAALCEVLDAGLGDLYVGSDVIGKVKKTGGVRDRSREYTAAMAVATVAVAELEPAMQVRNNKILSIWKMPRPLLGARLGPDDVEAVVLVKVTGDAMKPEYSPGDMVLVNSHDKTPTDGDFVIFDSFGKPLVRKLQSTGRGKKTMLKIISLNKAYDSDEVPADKIAIYGKVIAKWCWK